MLRELRRRFGTRRWLALWIVSGLALVAGNGVVFNHAWSMTHFVAGGTKTPKPEELSFAGKLRVCLAGVNLPRPVNGSDPGSLVLAFETRKFGGADGADLEAWYIPHAGAKGLVLLAHGYAACKSSLLPDAKAFHDMGYATLLLDFRGSGGSRGNETTIGFCEADDVAAAVQYAEKNFPIRPLILYGQSMGSAAILRAVAFRDVRPAGIIVECPFDSLLSTAENRFATMGLPGFPLAHLLIFWGGVQQGFNGFGHNPAEYARQVRCPVLLLHGAHDVRVTPAQAQTVFQNFAGEKTLVVFPDAGHESFLSASPELWRRSITAFLRKLPPT